jgi:hypothetical protein
MLKMHLTPRAAPPPLPGGSYLSCPVRDVVTGERCRWRRRDRTPRGAMTYARHWYRKHGIVVNDPVAQPDRASAS